MEQRSPGTEPASGAPSDTTEMKLIQRPFASLILFAAAVLAVWGLQSLFARFADRAPAQAPLISLEKMGHLVSVKVNYSDIIEFDNDRTLGIPWSQWQVKLGGTKVLLVARGDCMVATNLGGARYKSVDTKNRTVTVVLPAPQPLNARINHDARQKGGSYFYAISSHGLEPIIPDSRNRTEAIDLALGLAQKEVLRSCSQPAVRATARQNAEAVLLASYRATQWTPAFVWE